MARTGLTKALNAAQYFKGGTELPIQLVFLRMIAKGGLDPV